MNFLNRIAMSKELQEKLDFWNQLKEEVEFSDAPQELKEQMLSELHYNIVCIEDELDRNMQNKTITAMSATLIMFCCASASILGWAVAVKYFI
jgi:hypothetical protein